MNIARALIVAACFAAAPAAAQDYNADPNFGTLNLASGFTPDPQVVAVRSGGEINAATISQSCQGFISNAPDVRLNYTAGSLPLIISVAADADTTLVVNGPDGSWYCDDDGGENGHQSDGPLQRAGERPVRHLDRHLRQCQPAAGPAQHLRADQPIGSFRHRPDLRALAAPRRKRADGVRLNIEVDLDYHFPEATDVLLAVEVAQLADQVLIEDLLTVDGSGPLRPIAGEDGTGRRTWLRAEGHCRVSYRATRRRRPPRRRDRRRCRSCRRATLPAEVVPYLWPSRYCESDRFEAFVERTFGGVDGGAKALAMAEWIRREVDYVIGSSDATTTAVDAFVSRQGVCRDFAHLMASFARAAGIPARLVSAYAWGLKLPDFHAVVEVWLDGAWHLVDATGLAPLEGLARICVGRDATDIAFMTIFGRGEMHAQSVQVTRLDE